MNTHGIWTVLDHAWMAHVRKLLAITLIVHREDTTWFQSVGKFSLSGSVLGEI